MDVALLVFSVLGLIAGVSAIFYAFFLVADSKKDIRQGLSQLAEAQAEFELKNREMGDSAASLGKLHNDQIAKLKSITERIETLELRFHAVTPPASKRSF